MKVAKDWPHAPVNRLVADGVYLVTAAVLYNIRLTYERSYLARLN